jgi:hypothetical protein
MSRWQRLSSLTAPISVPVSLIFSVLPRTWIESTFTVDSEGVGSGVRELMHVSVPVPLAIAFAAYLFRKPAPAPRLNERPYQSTVVLNS